MTQFISGGSTVFRNPTLVEFSFAINVQPGYVDHAEVRTDSTQLDAVVTSVATEYSDPYYDLQVLAPVPIELEVLDETGVLVDGRLTKVSDGICRVIARHPWLSRSVSLDMTRVNSNVYDELKEYASGSLANNITANMAAIATGKTAASKLVYTTQDHANSVYVRNPTCWAASLNMTAISPWNSTGGIYRAGIAITPRNTFHATHYLVPTGTTLRFVAADNTVVERTVTDYEIITTEAADLQVTVLDTDLPASITPVKLLPANAFDYLPSFRLWPLDLLALDGQEHALAMETYWDAGGQEQSLYARNSTKYPALTESIIGGDSGNPICLVINSELVVVSHWSSSYRGGLYHLHLTEIASALTSLGGGYTLSTVDLSSFMDYSP